MYLVLESDMIQYPIRDEDEFLQVKFYDPNKDTGVYNLISSKCFLVTVNEVTIILPNLVDILKWKDILAMQITSLMVHITLKGMPDA